MNKSEKALLLGKVVKNVMALHGKCAWQNIYKTGTRSIKCYSKPGTDARLEQDLGTILSGNSMEIVWEIKRTKGCREWGAPALIVKLYPHYNV